MNKPRYAEHERRRHQARIDWGLAILDDIAARVAASSEPDNVVAFDIGDAIFAWELDEGAEEIRQAIGGPLAWDDSPDSGEEPPPAQAALLEARDNLERRAAFYGLEDRTVNPTRYHLDTSETFMRRAKTALAEVTATLPECGERAVLTALHNALERSLKDAGN